MAKKIKHKTKSKEEREEDKRAAEEERERQAVGIQDDFQARGFELAEWAQDNQSVVLGLIAAVLIAGAALWGYTVMSRSTDTGASSLYASALKSYGAPVGDALPGEDDTGPRFDSPNARAKDALDKFRKVTTEYSGSGAATLAALYAGHASMQLGEYDDALTHYDAYLKGTPSSDPLYALGLEGRAAARDAKADVDGAISDLEAITARSVKVGKDAAYVKLARMYKNKGDNEKAKQALDRFDSDFPESPLKGEATELRAEVAPGSEAPAPALPSPETK